MSEVKRVLVIVKSRRVQQKPLDAESDGDPLEAARLAVKQAEQALAQAQKAVVQAQKGGNKETQKAAKPVPQEDSQPGNNARPDDGQAKPAQKPAKAETQKPVNDDAPDDDDDDDDDDGDHNDDVQNAPGSLAGGEDALNADDGDQGSPAGGAGDLGDGYGDHNVSEGDHVAFTAGEFKGRGKVASAGKDGCTVADQAGREHSIFWHEVTGHHPTDPDLQENGNEETQKPVNAGTQKDGNAD